MSVLSPSSKKRFSISGSLCLVAGLMVHTPPYMEYNLVSLDRQLGVSYMLQVPDAMIAQTTFFNDTQLARRPRPTAIDLFCGAGGMTQGLRQAGFRVLGAIDVDPIAIATYRANHPRTRVWQAQIEKVPPTTVMDALDLLPGQLDLLAGCPPCQGFSSLRTLNGSREINDPRNDLLFEFLRFVTEFQPRTVMLENVPGLDTDPRIVQFCHALEEMGYVWRRAILNAADYGVPQRRRRMILLAGRHGPINFAPKDRVRRTVRDAIGHLPAAGQSGDPLHDLPEKRDQRIMDLIRRIPHNGGSRMQLGPDHQLRCHQRLEGFHDIYGRMAWEDVAPTITSGCFNPSKGRFLHPDQDRNITQREAALLQTFPPNYRFSLTRGKTYVASLIGNALPPRFVERHAREICKYLQAVEPAPN